MPVFSLTRLCVFAALAIVPPLHADCELLYAPAGIRARALAFHHAHAQRRAAQGRLGGHAAAAPRARNADAQRAGNRGRRDGRSASLPRSG